MKTWELTRSAILAVPVPANTESYTAIPHSVFLDEVEAEILNKGMTIKSEQFLTSNNGQVLTGRFMLGDPNNPHPEMTPTVYIVNSYNKMRRASIRGGAVVLVCKNGMLGNVGHGSFTRKHTGSALEEFRQHIISVISGLENEFQRLVRNAEEMKAIHLRRELRAQLVGDMLINEDLISPNQLAVLRKEIKQPTHFKGDSVWDFYNHCTEAFKDNHPMTYDHQHIKLHTYITDKFKLSGSRGLYGGSIQEATIVLDEVEAALAD